jgi:hypothetical protein
MSMSSRLSGKALTAERIGLSAVRRIAVADVERLQLGEGVLARHARSVGAAVEPPVVDDGEAPIGGWVDVELDHIRTGLEGRVHGGDGVLQVGVLRRIDALGRAGVTLEAFGGECLVQAAMGEQRRLAGAWRAELVGVVQIDEGRERQDKSKSDQ